MRICFVSTGSLREFQKNYEEEEDALLLFGFSGMGEVSYEKELKGESDEFTEGALLSKRSGAVVICGCITNAKGHKRRSALVAEGGRILGVSDMLYVIDGEYGSGAELRIYDTKAGRMGVLVGEDLYFPETVKALAMCGCDFIVCPFGKVTGELPAVLARAHAFQLGAPVFLCGEGYAAVATPKGEIAFSSPNSPVKIDYTWQKEYHLYQRRIRGNFQRSD